MFSNPYFTPLPQDLDVLYRRKRQEQDRTFRGGVPAGIVRPVTEKIAEQAVEALLAQMPPSIRWVNANRAQKNQPGYDYLVDDRLRVQVKGSDAVEQVGWSMKPSLDHPSYLFDVIVFVHVGVCLNTNYGRFAKYCWCPQEAVDFYIIPCETMRKWASAPRYLNKGRVELYWNRRAFGPGTKQEMGQTREILNYKNRFDILAAMVSTVTA